MADVTTTAINPSQSTVSPNFGNYIYDMLSKGWQAANLPFQPFEGQRYADTQPLLQQGFTSAQQFAQPRSFTDQGIAQQYMNPYTQGVVDIEQREAQRQAGIAGTQRNAAFTRSGAFGGARQAIENAEANRNLQTQLGDIQFKGLNQAYLTGQDQFNKEQGQRLSGVQQLLTAGRAQQELAQQPLDFGYSQWQDSLNYPYKQATYMQSLLTGMPVSSNVYTAPGSSWGSAIQGGLSGLALYNLMNKGG